MNGKIHTPQIDFDAIAAEDEKHFESFEIHWGDYALLFIFAALFLTVFLQFFTRYVLNDSLSWTEEAARYLLIILSFAGAIRCQVKGQHIVLEFVDKYYGRYLSLIHIVALVLIQCMMLALMFTSYELIQKTSFQNMLSLPFPKYYLHGVLMGLLTINSLVVIKQLATRLKRKEGVS